MLKAILFDLDDTLIHEERTVHDALNETCLIAEQRGAAVAEDLYHALGRVAGKLWNEFQGPERWGDMIGMGWWEALYGDFETGEAPLIRRLRGEVARLRQTIWESALEAAEIQEAALARELADHYRSVMRSRFLMFPETMDVLNGLRPRFLFGMITNGTPDVQNLKIDGCGLRGYFDPIVISGEFGLGKPRREIFDHARSRLSLESQECVMVGNSYERDVKGAINADMHPVWMNLHGEDPPHANVSFHVIENLIALPDLIEELQDGKI